jgi:hypothetical protein
VYPLPRLGEGEAIGGGVDEHRCPRIRVGGTTGRRRDAGGAR